MAKSQIFWDYHQKKIKFQGEQWSEISRCILMRFSLTLTNSFDHILAHCGRGVKANFENAIISEAPVPLGDTMAAQCKHCEAVYSS